MILSYAILPSFLFINLCYLRAIVSSNSYLKNQARLIKNSRARNSVTILIPLYKEGRIALETVSYFSELASKLSCDVVFVTTAREGSLKNNETFQMVRKLVDQHNYLSIKHYPYRHGAKASQLNWAMKKLGPHVKYFAIFDADSRPDFRGLLYVKNSRLQPDVFQMPTVYRPHPSESLASKALAVFQTRWTYCFEIPKWQQWQNNPNTSYPMYLVGHGIFLKNGIHFSEDTLTEDLELGYRLSAKRAQLNLVPYFDYATTPRKLYMAIIQSSRWYYGELFSLGSFIKLSKQSDNIIFYMCRATIRYVQILLWMLGPVLVLLATALSVASPLLLGLAIVNIAMYCYALHILVCRYQGLSLSYVILLPVKAVLNGLGPMLCAYFVMLDALNIRKFHFTKTER